MLKTLLDNLSLGIYQIIEKIAWILNTGSLHGPTKIYKPNNSCLKHFPNTNDSWTLIKWQWVQNKISGIECVIIEYPLLANVYIP